MTRDQEAWEEARDRIALNHALSPTVVAAGLAAMRAAGVPLDVAEQEYRRVLRSGTHNAVALGQAVANGYVAGWRARTLRAGGASRDGRSRGSEDAL